MSLTNEDLQAIAGLLQPIKKELLSETQKTEQNLRSEFISQIQVLRTELHTEVQQTAQILRDEFQTQINQSEQNLRKEIRSSENLILEEVSRVHHILERHMNDKTRHSA